MQTNEFTRTDLATWDRQQCGHGSHTGDRCPMDSVARVAPANAPWFKRFRCEEHAADYMSRSCR